MQTAFVLIDAQPDRIRELAAELAGTEGVAEAYPEAGEAHPVALGRGRRVGALAEGGTRPLR